MTCYARENKGIVHFRKVRSFTVAIDKIDYFTSELLQAGKQELPISRNYRHEVEKELNN